MGDVDTFSKVFEKSEKARQEFRRRVEKLIQSRGKNLDTRFLQELQDQAGDEYFRLFGRVGIAPLLHLKNGKRRPRYLLDREEVWVLYKPALWQMGGTEWKWMQDVQGMVSRHRKQSLCQQELLNSEQVENAYIWHGIAQGVKWMDPERPVSGWGFIQRLDVETDGPVIVAKTWREQRCLQVQMKDHVFSKAYMALVHGKVDNRTVFVRTHFVELGNESATQVMLKHDLENDPFYEWTDHAHAAKRPRTAETFYKPIAYFKRKEDNTEYSLVYVNILTGITHQVRITMQSVGHPLVSDDRYLPKDQAMADLAWCPRNFLVEVRSDWFDLCGPQKPGARTRATRISMENPLPDYMQKVLETKLTLVERLDPTADLYVGCQYWALGDEQLMTAYPKDTEYRQRVVRWGQRRGIHLDALERLLLLPKDEIDTLLNHYRPADDRGSANWVCPKCMSYNGPGWYGEPSTYCVGYMGEDCNALRVMDEEDVKLPKGWLNYLSDPTFHFLMLVNPKWLEARRRVLKNTRPSWEKAPPEDMGTAPTEEILSKLEAFLKKDAAKGGSGISEGDLNKVPGLETVIPPLNNPPENSAVRRVRLPGSGSQSRWVYTLRGKDRTEILAEFDASTKSHFSPLPVTGDPLPACRVLSAEDKAKKKAEAERQEQLKREKEEELERLKKEKEEEQAARALEKAKDRELASLVEDLPPLKKRKTGRNWQKKESGSHPGKFYYWDAETGETTITKPPDYEESKPVWERVESSSNPGHFYYHNSETGENRIQRPAGVEVVEENGAAKEKELAKVVSKEDGGPWERKESSSKPGHYYYFNSRTGANEIDPPVVDLPWTLIESKSKKGQYYYHNEHTSTTSVDPPMSARAKGAKTTSAPTLPVASKPILKENLPPGWSKKASDKYKGKFYYVNENTGENSWTNDWEHKESSSKPGKFYWLNAKTGQSIWDAGKA